MKIVVTGAAGFIGSNIIKGLNARGIDEVIAVDNLTQGDKFKNLADLQIADYVDADTFVAAVANAMPDFAFHTFTPAFSAAAAAAYAAEISYAVFATVDDAAGIVAYAAYAAAPRVCRADADCVLARPPCSRCGSGGVLASGRAAYETRIKPLEAACDAFASGPCATIDPQPMPSCAAFRPVCSAGTCGAEIRLR